MNRILCVYFCHPEGAPQFLWCSIWCPFGLFLVCFPSAFYCSFPGFFSRLVIVWWQFPCFFQCFSGVLFSYLPPLFLILFRLLWFRCWVFVLFACCDFVLFVVVLCLVFCCFLVFVPRLSDIQHKQLRSMYFYIFWSLQLNLGYTVPKVCITTQARQQIHVYLLHMEFYTLLHSWETILVDSCYHHSSLGMTPLRMTL